MYPTEAMYLQKTSLSLNLRIQFTKDSLKQLFPELNNCDFHEPTIIDNSQEAAKFEEDILVMVMAISENNLLPKEVDTDRGLVNTFIKQRATPEQQHDLMSFREVGEQATTAYIEHHIIRCSSATTTTI